MEAEAATSSSSSSPWDSDGGYVSSGQREKDDRTPVTVADFAVQALVSLGTMGPQSCGGGGQGRQALLLLVR